MAAPQSESMRPMDMTAAAPPRHGRRLIQMLFRANQGAAGHQDTDSRWEEHQAFTGSHPSRQQNTPRSSHGALPRQEPPTGEPARVGGLQPLDGGPVRPANGKFSALKRKLFPSMQRRAPLRVPALLPLSPSNTNAAMSSSPDLAQQPQQADGQRDDNGSDDAVVDFKADGNGNEAGDMENNVGHDDDQPGDCWHSSSVNRLVRSGQASTTCEPAESARPNYDSDEDDRDLELAVEVLDYESSNAEETLAEMTRAIDQVREWKHQHDHKTLQLMRQMEQQVASLPAITSLEESNADESVETMVTAFREEREKLQLDFNRDAFDSHVIEPCAPLCPALGEAEAARIAEALHTDQAGVESHALARLRDELFQLEVRERHAEMQAAMLQELEGAETALDLKIVDVEAFTSALDSVLAQFDAAAHDSSH